MRATNSFRFLAIGLLVAGISTLTACGDNPAPSAAPAPVAAPTTPVATAPAATPVTPAPAAGATDPKALMVSMGCAACHKTDAKLVGPSYQDVAKKYSTQKGAKDLLVTKVMDGGSGVWGPVAMTPNKNNPMVSKEKVEVVVDWILKGAK